MKKVSLMIASAMIIFAISCKDNNRKEAENDMENSTMTEDTTENNSTNSDMEDNRNTKQAVANLQAESDSNLSGKVTFTEENGEVKMKAEIMGLEEGKHAIHIHEKGDCSAPDGKSAGGHWNPTNQPHGKWGNEEGYHKGDIGNFTTDANGKGTISLSTDEWCIGCNDENKNILDKAIIVHNGQDDFTSQPSGAAGTRMGCGVIEMQ